jgi:hypothetical protein
MVAASSMRGRAQAAKVADRGPTRGDASSTPMEGKTNKTQIQDVENKKLSAEKDKW